MHPLLRSLHQAVSCDGNVISLKALSSSEVPPDNCRRPFISCIWGSWQISRAINNSNNVDNTAPMDMMLILVYFPFLLVSSSFVFIAENVWTIMLCRILLTFSKMTFKVDTIYKMTYLFRWFKPWQLRVQQIFAYYL